MPLARPNSKITPRQAKQASIHSRVNTAHEQLPGGFSGQLIAFCGELRGEGMVVGTSELMDAGRALQLVSFSDQQQFKEALAATLTKSTRDREIFDQVFDRFFFRAAEAEAIRRHATDDELRENSEDPSQSIAVGDGEGQGEGDGSSSGQGNYDFDKIRETILEALSNAGQSTDLKDLARLGLGAAKGQVDLTGIVGVDIQRIKRALDLQPPPGSMTVDNIPSEVMKRYEQELREELERGRAQRIGELPTAKPLADMSRSLASASATEVAEVQRIVRMLRRKLRTEGLQMRGYRRRKRIDMRATIRESLQTGGVPIVIKERQVRPHKPELLVICDVSTSVSTASVFFLAVMHAMHESFARMRSFVFVERISEVTDLMSSSKDIKEINEKISREAGIADVSGYTDYGRVWSELHEQVHGDLHPRTTIIVLGDARTNGRDPATGSFSQLADQAGRTIWLNPEPKLYWDYGDSVISRYAAHCEVFECWTSKQLEEFVSNLASGKTADRNR